MDGLSPEQKEKSTRSTGAHEVVQTRVVNTGTQGTVRHRAERGKFGG